MANALNQDIELRIRFAEYFAHVSAPTFQKGWIDYHDELIKRRDKIREEINEMEDEWQDKAQNLARGKPKLGHLERGLDWRFSLSS